jgi:hypothetical protein
LYSDPKFSSELVSIITNQAKIVRSEPEIRQAAIFINALAHDVIIHQTQLRYIDDFIEAKGGTMDAFNFNLVIDNLCCTKITAIQTRVSEDFINLPTLTVGCAHSLKNRSFLELDCLNLKEESQIIDSISLLATEEFKRLEIFDAAVSQFEYSLIKKYRRFKYKLPPRLNRILYPLFRK